MSVNRDKKRGTWMTQVRFRDMFGQWHKTTKRGFKTKADAKAWEADFRAPMNGSLDMTFAQFYVVYTGDVRPRVKLSTWLTKEHIVRTKLLPFFGDTKVRDIRPADVVRWENWLLTLDLSQTYLRTVVNQLSAVLNHAVRYYGLPANPVLAAGKIGTKRPEEEMKYWLPEEHDAFSEQVADKPDVHHAFEILYFTGIRCGELLALTPAHIDLNRSLILVRGTYQRIGGEDVITSPKTKGSVRDVLMPDFLHDELEDYLATRPELGPDERIFKMTKHRLRHEMARGAEKAGVKPIRIHDLRHSHTAHLIALGFSAQAIASRLGHSTTEVTETYPISSPPSSRASPPRSTRQVRRVTARTTDAKGRWRSKTVAFRMSDEEAEQLDLLVSLSGLSKQQFIISALLDPKVSIHATVRTRRAVRKEMGALTAELRRVRRAGDMPEGLAESVDTVARFVGSFEPESSPVDEEDDAIRNLARGGGDTRQSTAAAPTGNPSE